MNQHNDVVIACEVKARSIKIDWQNISRAQKIIESNPALSSFIFLLENRNFMLEANYQEIMASEKIKTNTGRKISFLSINDVYRLASTISDSKTISQICAKNISRAPSIKSESKKLWAALS